MASIYKTADEYIESAATISAKITRINEIQDALLNTVFRAVLKGEISQYSFNNGQTIIQTTYRDPDKVMEAYHGLEKIKNVLINKTTRVVQLMDRKNFTGRR